MNDHYLPCTQCGFPTVARVLGTPYCIHYQNICLDCEHEMVLEPLNKPFCNSCEMKLEEQNSSNTKPCNTPGCDIPVISTRMYCDACKLRHECLDTFPVHELPNSTVHIAVCTCTICTGINNSFDISTSKCYKSKYHKEPSKDEMLATIQEFETKNKIPEDSSVINLLNKINSTIPRLNKLLPKSRQCTKGGITQCPNCAEEGGNWCSWHEGHQAYSPYYCATCGISHHEFI